MKTTLFPVLIAALCFLNFKSDAQLATEPDWRIHHGTVENVWTDQNWGRFLGKVVKGSNRGGIWCEGYFSSPQTTSFVPDSDMSDTDDVEKFSPSVKYDALIKNLPGAPAVGQEIDVMVRYRGEGIPERSVNLLGGIDGRQHSTIVGNEAPSGKDSLILDFCNPTDSPHLNDADLQRYSAAKSNRLKVFEEADARRSIVAKEAIDRQQNAEAQKQAERDAKANQAFNAEIDWANRGIASSQYKLGMRYLNGDGVTKDDTIGKQWLEKASAQGNFDAKVVLSAATNNIDFNDRGIMSDLRSAMIGIDSSQYKLGMRFLDGDGVPKDKTIAKEWLNKAATNGNSDAKKALSSLPQ